MRIALVTGRLAGEAIRKIVSGINVSGIELVVVELPIPVAAMMSDTYLEKELPRHMDVLGNVDLVIVPGYTSGDLTRISELIGKPVVKGVKYMYDIPLMIKAISNGIELSPRMPADDVVRLYRAERDKEVLRGLREKASTQYYFTIGDRYKIYVSPVYPIIIHEVYTGYDACTLDDIVKKSEKALLDGADIVVVGFPHNAPVDIIEEVVAEVKKRLGRPIGVDVEDVNALLKAAEAGADVLMSLSYSKIMMLDNVSPISDKGVVLIPDHSIHGEDKLSSLVEAYKLAVEKGLSKIIVDPVLDPPLSGLASSLERYRAARRLFPHTPLLMGVGNVTELIDADSVGVNAILASIGVEIGVEAYLTTEASVKTRGSTRELRRALDMCLIARNESRPPKDLSINLLLLKDKRRKSIGTRQRGIILYARERRSSGIDPKGVFKIYVDHDAGNIIVEHYRLGELEPDYTIIGNDPYAILSEITGGQLASKPEHYFYLGYELSKAYVALKTGKEYVQEEDLFEDT
ncbi:dihydropteroate synthase-like protein [Desulfurococcus amylolyticus]|uniref:dihydropteroate synthase-like protein n=1 Tax=Desulfurococcus amylolyticus TaxID=94694 RepID=UPI000662887D|nr:dihydropteroate synthase-like protein [Desulfurococcus amylolyticus]